MSVVETDVSAVEEGEAGGTSGVNGYRTLRLLGEGAFSRVYECENGAGQHYALKVLNKSFLKRKREYKRVGGKLVLSNAFQKVQKEVAIMKKLAHTHLVKLHEVIDSPADDKMFLVLDLIRGGQVMDWDDKSFRYRSSHTPKGVLGRSAVRACLRDVVAALDYLHRNRICHRDIKPENILLSSAEEGYKLADFGVAHILEPEDGGGQALLRSTEGTYHFLAPECTTGMAYDPFQVDIWALGVTMFVLLCGTLPFGTQAASLDAVMASIREDALVLPEYLAPECAELLARMLNKDPSARITIPQLLEHPWLSNTTALPLTPRDGLDAAQSQGESVVHVSDMEIEAAFTPVNNFILMTKLKMKLGTRLARARKSIDSRQEIVGGAGAHARRATHLRSPAVHPHKLHSSSDNVEISPVVDGLPVASVATPTTTGDGKLCEISSSEASPGRLELQKRKSRLTESLAGTMDALSTLRSARLPRRNSALTVRPRATPSSNVAATGESPLQADAAFSQHSTFIVELVGGEGHSDMPVPDSPVAAVTDSSRSIPALINTVAVEGAGHSPVPQTRPPRLGLSRRSSAIAQRIGATIDNTAEPSSPTFSDISGGAQLHRRKSALASLGPTHSSARPRSCSPYRAARLDKLGELPGREAKAPGLQGRYDAPGEHNQPYDGHDVSEEAGVGPSALTTAGTHEEDALNVDAAVCCAPKALTALPAHHKEVFEVGGDTSHALATEDDAGHSTRPQSPSSPRSRRRLGSHPTPLPPLDLSSAPCTPTTRSPATSPVAPASPKRFRHASVDRPHPLTTGLATEAGEQVYRAPLPPSRRHSSLECRPPSLEHHALPAFAALPTASSPRTDSTTYHSSEVEFSFTSSCHSERDTYTDVIPPTQVPNEAVGDGPAVVDRPLGPMKPSTSTPHLPRCHSPVPPGLSVGSIHPQSTLERESPMVCSTGSLSPRHKLSPPSRFEVAAPVIVVPIGDPPIAPSETTASIVRMSSLAKALDNCLPPEDNAAYYSAHPPRPSSPEPATDAADPATPATAIEPTVDAEVEGPVQQVRMRRKSTRQSLLEAQDSLKLVNLERQSSAKPNRPRTSVCELM